MYKVHIDRKGEIGDLDSQFRATSEASCNEFVGSLPENFRDSQLIECYVFSILSVMSWLRQSSTDQPCTRHSKAESHPQTRFGERHRVEHFLLQELLCQRSGRFCSADAWMPLASVLSVV